jgi:tRNA dimethylallyltransferase
MQKVIAIIGPTASGKTALGIALAKKLKGEIISADSRQLYRGMDIIAATPSTHEMKGIPHHLMRAVDPKRQFSAGRFVREGERLIRAINKRGKIPIVVGGTGFYADALLSGLSLPPVAPNARLRARLQKKTAPQLLAQLKKLDPARAKEVDPHNKVRLMRAIEIAAALGKVPELSREPRFEVLWLGLSPAPDKHRAAVRKRIRERMRHGMLAEAKRLRSRLSERRFRSLGSEFSYLADALDKRISPAQLEQKLEQWEVKYAKRQMRWHRRNKDIAWVKNKTEALKLAKQFLK